MRAMLNVMCILKIKSSTSFSFILSPETLISLSKSKILVCCLKSLLSNFVSTFFLCIGNHFISNPFLVLLDFSVSELFLYDTFCCVFFSLILVIPLFCNSDFFSFVFQSFFLEIPHFGVLDTHRTTNKGQKLEIWEGLLQALHPSVSRYQSLCDPRVQRIYEGGRELKRVYKG